MPTTDEARGWLGRWDRQQEHYLPDRERRFGVIVDVVEQVVQRPDPLVVDLGVGPGSLANRLLARIPDARVVGVDADPLLMGLGRIAGADERLRFVEADLRSPGWVEALHLDRAPDAFVSTTALHWMDATPLRACIAECARVLATPGVFVDGDHIYETESAPGMDELNRAIGAAYARRLRVDEHEDWAAWWQAVEAAPELAGLLAAREAAKFEHVVTDKPTLADYLAFLRDAGFSTVGQVWQYGDDRVLVGAR